MNVSISFVHFELLRESDATIDWLLLSSSSIVDMSIRTRTFRREKYRQIMHSSIQYYLLFLIFIISIEGKTINTFSKDYSNDPNDDPMDTTVPTTTTTTTTKRNAISLASMSCLESHRCGCYKGYCWAYIDEYQTPATGWWCFTQHEGIRGKQKLWATCHNSSQCSWTMTCGDCYTYVGKRTGIKTDQILC